jgi:hypothetical protein
MASLPRRPDQAKSFPHTRSLNCTSLFIRQVTGSHAAATIKHPDMTITSVTLPPATREQQTADESSTTVKECSTTALCITKTIVAQKTIEVVVQRKDDIPDFDKLSTNEPPSSGMTDGDEGPVFEVTDAIDTGKNLHFNM